MVSGARIDNFLHHQPYETSLPTRRAVSQVWQAVCYRRGAARIPVLVLREIPSSSIEADGVEVRATHHQQLHDFPPPFSQVSHIPVVFCVDALHRSLDGSFLVIYSADDVPLHSLDELFLAIYSGVDALRRCPGESSPVICCDILVCYENHFDLSPW